MKTQTITERRLASLESKLKSTYKPYIVPVTRGQSKDEAMRNTLATHELEAIESYPSDQLSVIFLVGAEHE